MINGLAERLQKLRLMHNFSQKEVSQLLGISPSIVSGYETGERTPSAENLLALSYLYKCSTDYLLGKERIVPTVTLDITGLNEDQIHAIQTLIRCMKN